MDRMSSSDSPSSDGKPGDRWIFEETYPRYEFPELVRFALALGAWLAKVRRGLRRPTGPSSTPLPGQMNPAE
jgi:hypothetical protein